MIGCLVFTELYREYYRICILLVLQHGGDVRGKVIINIGDIKGKIAEQ